MKNKKIPVFIIGVAIALISVAAHPAASTQAVKALQPIISLLLFSDEDEVLKNVRISRQGKPEIGEEFNLELVSIEGKTISKINCHFANKPLNSLAEVSVNSRGLMTFTPDLKGAYIVRCQAGLESIDIEIVVDETPNYSPEDVEGFDGLSSFEDIVGQIRNQSWVYSQGLSNADIEELLSEYSFEVVGFDKTFGVLIEYDSSNPLSHEELEELKLRPGISDVFNRLHIGENIDLAYSPSTLPRGYTEQDFMDGGENWYLEKIKIREAWDITTGSDDFYIGVSDNGFNRLHDDLTKRWGSNFSRVTASHGTSVAGAIGASEENTKGGVGVNWSNKLVFGDLGKDYLKFMEILNENAYLDKPVKIINSSWAANFERIPSKFHPENNIELSEWERKIKLPGKIHRRLIAYKKSQDKLFVWAAGNGIGNGLGSNITLDHPVKIYGVDAKYDSGNLHYDKGQYRPLDNLIVVGALNIDNKLNYDSNFGESVDIVAPAGYLAPKYDPDDPDNNSLYTTGFNYGGNVVSTGFSGTSAAAPLVSGVASLIFSLDPSFFTPNLVKKVLISSSTESVTVRNADILPPVRTEILDLSIPILNAGNALKYAQELVSSEKLTAELTIVDASKNEIQVTLKTSSIQFLDQEFVLNLERYNSLIEDWESVVAGAVVTDSSIKLPLSAGYSEYRVSGSGQVLHQPTQIVKGSTLPAVSFKVVTVDLNSKHSVDQQRLPNVDLEIEPLGFNNSTTNYNVATDSNGSKVVYLFPGSYKIHASANGFLDTPSELSVPENVEGSISKDVPLSPVNAPLISSLSGHVISQNGHEIANALVSIVGGGFTTSTTTNEAGQYHLTGIPKELNGNEIFDFTLTVSAFGYDDSVIENVVVLRPTSGERLEPPITLVESNVPLLNVDVGLIKSVASVEDISGNGIIGVRDVINYRFFITNQGDETLTVSVTDPLISNLNCSFTGLVSLASKTCTGAYVITQDDVDKGAVENSSTVTATPSSGLPPIQRSSDAGTDTNGEVILQPLNTETSSPLGLNPNDPDDPSDDPTTFKIVDTYAAVFLRKSVKSISSSFGVLTDEVDADDKISYEFSVINDGNLSLNLGPIVDDKLGSISCDLSVIAPNDVAICSGNDYMILQSDIDAGGVENSATITVTPPYDPRSSIDKKSDTGTDADGNLIVNSQFVETPNPLGGYFNDSSDPADDPTTLTLVTPSQIKPSNDTGITFGGDFPSSNNSDCSGITITQQDCYHGRDATHNDDSDGHAGFSYTKLNNLGVELSALATDWSCVRDNVTELVWEVKTDDGGEHDKDNDYKWGGDSVLGSGYGEYFTDWNQLINSANNSELCGYSDWRIPSPFELMGLVNFNVDTSGIDDRYFPRTRNIFQDCYWTNTHNAVNEFRASCVQFNLRTLSHVYTGTAKPVRLIRGDSQQ
ncbi:MAG: subtilisin family serine protease [Arenicella sp.]|jgi:subtilisin family serine protease